MPATERSETPVQRKTNGAKRAEDEDPRRKVIKESVNGKIVERRQTRPIGEFGGNFGTGFWMIFIPVTIWYVYGLVVLNHGEFMVPDADFWSRLIWELPEGIAIRPTWKGTGAFILWILLQGLFEMIIPGKVVEGVQQKNGNKLKYPMNGLASYFLSHIVCFALVYFGVIEGWFVWRNMGALLTGAVITTNVISLWIYIDWGIFWRRHVDEFEFEEDWGVFNLSECVNDYFLGVARNPRIFRWLERWGVNGVALDVKRFTNARPSLTGWVMCNVSYLAAIYYNCQLKTGGEEPVCAAIGDFERVGWPALLITAAHTYYIFDYNWNEPAYLTTTDIRHDLYGWMLAYGCMGFLCWYYPIAFLGHLAAAPTPLNDNPVQLAVGLTLCAIGMFFFRATNIQKHNFRTYIADGGDLSKYMVWGKPVEYVQTELGPCLLCSGWWGLARHFNYIGDLTMCIGWAIACSGPNHGFPWPPVSYCLYFWIMDIHRMFRDEDRCMRKYGKDWVKYQATVRYYILPGIF